MWEDAFYFNGIFRILSSERMTKIKVHRPLHPSIHNSIIIISYFFNLTNSYGHLNISLLSCNIITVSGLM